MATSPAESLLARPTRDFSATLTSDEADVLRVAWAVGSKPYEKRASSEAKHAALVSSIRSLLDAVERFPKALPVASGG